VGRSGGAGCVSGRCRVRTLSRRACSPSSRMEDDQGGAGAGGVDEGGAGGGRTGKPGTWEPEQEPGSLERKQETH